MRKRTQQMQQLPIQFINYLWQLLHVSALHCHLQGALLVPSEIATHHVTTHNTPVHNNVSTVPQLSISQKALGTLPEDGNVMTKHIEYTIRN
jgi:hypothetical protein